MVKPLGLWIGAPCLALLLALAACHSSGSSGGGPSITVDDPSDGSSFAVTAQVTIVATATEEVLSVELRVDDAVVAVDDTIPFEFAWEATPVGEHTVEVVGQLDIGRTVSDAVDVRVAATIRVPDDEPTVQAAINAADPGEFILLSPGTYTENLRWEGKTLSLVSRFHIDGDEDHIEQTILDGDGGRVIRVERAGRDSQIIGLTVQNGTDGVFAASYVDVLHCRILNNEDGIDYEPDGDFGGSGSRVGGGTVANCLFENNSDDGIDLDYSAETLIVDNIIRNNGDDGIEIRLHEYTGDLLQVTIRGNTITGNGEDGIQLIGYDSETSRAIRIERNVIADSVDAGIGFMDDGETTEDFRGAQVPEPVDIVNNTFSGNRYGITGGGNAVIVNNLFVDSAETALLKARTDSQSSYNLFWNNGTDYEQSRMDLSTTLLVDPELEPDYELAETSPARDAGVARFRWRGERVVDWDESEYSGSAPDLGAIESVP